jgi:hypothetical protein
MMAPLEPSLTSRGSYCQSAAVQMGLFILGSVDQSALARANSKKIAAIMKVIVLMAFPSSRLCVCHLFNEKTLRFATFVKAVDFGFLFFRKLHELILS